MGVKRAVIGALVLACLAMTGCLIIGCSNNDEQQVRSIATAELQALKDKDPELLNFASDVPEIQQLESVGISPQELLSGFLDNFDYTITDVSIEGNSTTVTAKITVKDAGAFTQKLEGFASDPQMSELIDTMNEDEIKTLISGTTMSLIKETPTTEKTISIPLVKEGGTWTIPEEGADAFLPLFS